MLRLTAPSYLQSKINGGALVDRIAVPLKSVALKCFDYQIGSPGLFAGWIDILDSQ